jgi:RNA polymerase sigma-70 factor (ECF subfamily)
MTKSQFIKEFVPLSDKVFRLAFRYLNNSEMAKDIVQSIYLKLWNKKNELKKFTNKEAYVIRMAKNACLDKIKLTKNTIDVAHYHNPVNPDYDNAESAYIVKKIISTLPDLQKRIIELRDIEGFTFEEISEILGLSINNIRPSLSIARKKVREEFKKIYSYGLQEI